VPRCSVAATGRRCWCLGLGCGRSDGRTGGEGGRRPGRWGDGGGDRVGSSGATHHDDDRGPGDRCRSRSRSRGRCRCWVRGRACAVTHDRDEAERRRGCQPHRCDAGPLCGVPALGAAYLGERCDSVLSGGRAGGDIRPGGARRVGAGHALTVRIAVPAALPRKARVWQGTGRLRTRSHRCGPTGRSAGSSRVNPPLGAGRSG